MQVQASKVRKGQKVWILGVLVEVTKREKWGPRLVKIHFKDIGNGVPDAKYPVDGPAEFVRLDDLLELGE